MNNIFIGKNSKFAEDSIQLNERMCGPSLYIFITIYTNKFTC